MQLDLCQSPRRRSPISLRTTLAASTMIGHCSPLAVLNNTIVREEPLRPVEASGIEAVEALCIVASEWRGVAVGPHLHEVIPHASLVAPLLPRSVDTALHFLVGHPTLQYLGLLLRALSLCGGAGAVHCGAQPLYTFAGLPGPRHEERHMWLAVSENPLHAPKRH